MQYVKHSNWRLKYSVKWRTEILKVTIHHFTITLSLSSMRESDGSIWIPITHSCEQEMLLPLPLPAHWPPPGQAQTGITPRPIRSTHVHNTSLSCPLTQLTLPCRSVWRDICIHWRGKDVVYGGKKFNSSISISNKIKLELQVGNFSDAWYFFKKFEAHYNLSF